MRRAIPDGPKDPAGRLILGDPRAVCRWCAAEAVVTYSGCGRIAWWHPPADCCAQRKAATAKRHPAGKARRNQPSPAERGEWWHR